MFEKLLTLLADLVTAINANTAALKSAPSTPTAAPAPVTDDKAAKEAEKARKAEEKAVKEKAAADKAAVDKAAAEKAAAEKAASGVVIPTVDDVRKVCQELLDATKQGEEPDQKPFLKSIKETYKIGKISDAPETARAEVIAKVKAQTAAVKAAPAGASNDI